MKRFAIFPLFASFCSFGSTFQCESEFAWLKSTFENNDAGFQYNVENKGLDLYSAHNSAILARVQSAKSEAQCHTALSDWLTFFLSELTRA
ncbi:MAG: peptidase S41, partial [Pseudomonadota bacterium]|nr:peptidase S41 [Pseudomonadota bacterium]